MKELGRHLNKTLISLAISVALVIYIYINRRSIFSSFEDIQLWYLVPVFVGQIGIQVANTLVLRTTLRPINKWLSFNEAFRLTTVSSFVNFFTPIVGGASLKAVYLKKRHDISYANFASVMYGNYLMFFISSFLLGLIGVAALPGALTSHEGQAVAVFFGAGIVASLLFMAFGHKITRLIAALARRAPRLKGIAKKVELVEEGWNAIRRDKRALVMMGFWSAVATLFVTLDFWGAMSSLDIHVSIWATLVFAALSIVGLLFNITPGSIGIREAVYASIYGITGVSAKQVVAFALIDRPANLLVIGLAWLLFSSGILGGMRQYKRLEHDTDAAD